MMMTEAMVRATMLELGCAEDTMTRAMEIYRSESGEYAKEALNKMLSWAHDY